MSETLGRQGCFPYGREEERAGFLIRVIAFSIDILVIVLIAGLFISWLGWLIDSSVLFLNPLRPVRGEIELLEAVLILAGFTLLLIPAVYFTYFHCSGGQTPGKMAVGIKVVNRDGSEPGIMASLLRSLGYLLSGSALLAGFLWVALDKQKQGWHDKLARTVVLPLKRQG